MECQVRINDDELRLKKLHLLSRFLEDGLRDNPHLISNETRVDLHNSVGELLSSRAYVLPSDEVCPVERADIAKRRMLLGRVSLLLQSDEEMRSE